ALLRQTGGRLDEAAAFTLDVWDAKLAQAGEALAAARAELIELGPRLDALQEKLYADGSHRLLVVLQGMDTSGKGGTIEHVIGAMNPQGCRVKAFKVPTEQERRHHFLWRIRRELPAPGQVGIFNRSHYEDVLVARVHPEILDHAKLPPRERDRKFWEERYEDINAFERHLHRNGTLILKFFLHLSKEEQKKRFLERLENPKKHWKFSLGDLAERKL
ncbi:MAG: PPK2 family polyphosphate kinase, partial [Vicinamibacteria bacterium]